MVKKYIISYLAAIILLVIAVRFLLPEGYLSLMSRISPYNFTIALFLTFLGYCISGMQFAYVLKKYYQTSLSPVDVYFLPIAMILWGYIVPIKGGLIYSVAFVKFKYHLEMTKGFIISIYIYLITIFLTGIVGLLFAVTKHVLFSPITFVSIAFLSSPAILIGLDKIMKRIPLRQRGLLKNIQTNIQLIVSSINILWENIPITINITALNILHAIASVLLCYWITIIFNLSLSVLALVVLVFLIKSALIFRVTPGDLGFMQILAGFVLSVLGGRISDGVILTLFITFTSFILAFTAGLIFTLYNLKYFTLEDIRETITVIESSGNQ